MFIIRDLLAQIEKYLNSPEILAVVGPRQSGKTTLLKHIFKQKKEKSAFLSFEDPQILSMFENNTKDFIDLYIKPNDFLFLDEFQYAKNGGKILKQIYDSFKTKIIISGSSSIDLTIKAVKFLVGRIFIFELLPFNFREFLRFKDEDYFNLYNKISFSISDIKKIKKLTFGKEIKEQFERYFEEYCLFGGYPRVIISQNHEEKIEVLKNIYSTYILREIKDYLGLIDDYKLQQLIKALALNIGNLIEYKAISSLSGYSFPSLKRYLNFLEKTYICCLIKPFFRNKNKEIVKNPKNYFIDTGLRNIIINDFRGLRSRTDSGFLIENGVFMQLKKSGLEIKYWRDKQQKEIDFIIEGPPEIALEVKQNLLKCQPSSFLRDFSKTYEKFTFSFLYQEGYTEKIKEKTYRIPSFLIKG